MVLKNDNRDAGQITQKAIIVRVVLSNGTHDQWPKEKGQKDKQRSTKHT
jgi:hypothetical protein